MAKITYIEHTTNKKHVIEVANGMTVMEGALQNNIPGIDAECGGGCACATCHVYVEKGFLNKIPEKKPEEIDMLDVAYEPAESSRLSCQIEITDQLDGLVVKIPLKQT